MANVGFRLHRPFQAAYCNEEHRQLKDEINTAAGNLGTRGTHLKVDIQELEFRLRH
jgi:hypothetical protein